MLLWSYIVRHVYFNSSDTTLPSLRNDNLHFLFVIAFSRITVIYHFLSTCTRKALAYNICIGIFIAMLILELDNEEKEILALSLSISPADSHYEMRPYTNGLFLALMGSMGFSECT